MCVIGLTLTLTTLAAFLLSPTQALAVSALAAVTGFFLGVAGKSRLRVVCVVCFSAAVALAGYTLFHLRSITPFQRAVGETVQVRGLVTEARKGPRAVFYTLDATFPGREDLPRANLSLRAFGEMDYVQGDIISCEVRLDDQAAVAGDYGFSQGVFASGQVTGEAGRVSGGFPIRRRLLELSRSLQNNVYAHLPKESADLVTTMVLGADNVDSDTYSVVNRAGTAHLLAVSGLHLSIVTAMVLRLLQGVRIPRRAAVVATVLAALAFSALVGFSASILRSFFMTTVALLARLGTRKSDSLSSLGFAVAIISLFFPAWLLGRGFWYSAGSALGIVVLGGPLGDRWIARLQGEGKIRGFFVRLMVGAAGVSAGAYVFTLPLFVATGGWISLVSPIANVLVAPFAAPVIAGGIVCAVTGSTAAPVQIVAALTDLCVRMVLKISQLMAGLPMATQPIDEVWILLALVFVFAAAAVLAIMKANRRVIAFACALAVMVCGLGSLTRSLMDEGTVELCFIADCNAAVLLRQDEAVILGTPDRAEIGLLLRYLEFRGVRSIAAVLATDSGEQVGSGLLRLGARYPIDCIVGPNDAYILGQLALAMTDIPVYSSGYARLELLGGVGIAVSPPHGDILVQTGSGTALKSAQSFSEYAIILLDDTSAEIELFPDGDVVLREAQGRIPSPIGAMLFGERRFRLRIG